MKRLVIWFLVVSAALSAGLAAAWFVTAFKQPNISAVQSMDDAIGRQLSGNLYPDVGAHLQLGQRESAQWHARIQTSDAVLVAGAYDFGSRSSALWAWIKASPKWNRSVWNYPSPMNVELPELKSGSQFVGFECSATKACDRWVLWKHVGHGIWCVELYGDEDWQAEDALEVMFPPGG